MKTVLPTLALLVAVVLPSLAAEPTASARRSSAKSVAGECPRCTQAPCRCGFSPSYYTRYRDPVRRRLAKHCPITPHWTRPRPTPVKLAVRSVVPSPRAPRVVPAPTPRQTLGYLPATRRRSGFHQTCAPFSRTSTLVPTPRRPRVVPARTARLRLGYEPSVSWTRYVGRRR